MRAEPVGGAADGLVVPQGSTGELEVRGDSVMLGYWQRPAETAEAFHDGWLRTGDMAWFDDDGFLYIADRLKDMIITGGENVFSSEVENALLRHDEVTECAVFGIPSERWGETVHAVVRRAADSTIDEAGLIAHCSMLIARFKCPKSIAFRSEPLPLSGVGKTLKTELRALYLNAQNP